MPLRQPAVAGQFYDAAAPRLRATVRAFLTQGAAWADKRAADMDPASLERPGARICGVMLPHAGHVYCGGVIGATLGMPWRAGRVMDALPSRLVVLCPNHTGLGRERLGIWPGGAWRTPLGDVAVDEDLSAALCGRGGFAGDAGCHLREHAIEVLLPFLQCLADDRDGPGRQFRITPVCVATRRPAALLEAGMALAAAMREAADGEIGLIVSSDMNHFEDLETTRRKDWRALEAALACDAPALLAVTERERISMCGAAPLALAFFALHALGRPWAEACAYDTSASASGDAARVVGYAGLRFGLA